MAIRLIPDKGVLWSAWKQEKAMDPAEILARTRAWIEAEIEKAKRPYADKFDLTSLSLCVHKAAGAEQFQAAERTLTVLRDVTLSKRLLRHDVVSAKEALAIIDYASLTS